MKLVSFWNCNDPFVNALKRSGYNINRLPKADIKPLQLLCKNGDDLERLGDADLNPAGVHVSKLVEADRLYITTAVIRSGKFTFDAKDSSGVGVQVGEPAIQGLVGGNVKVGTENSSTTKLTYEGPPSSSVSKPYRFTMRTVHTRPPSPPRAGDEEPRRLRGEGRRSHAPLQRTNFRQREESVAAGRPRTTRLGTGR